MGGHFGILVQQCVYVVGWRVKERREGEGDICVYICIHMIACLGYGVHRPYFAHV